MTKAPVSATIITIGDELLIGQTIDTNSAWMAQELNKLGIWVKRRVAVGDVYDEIWRALDEERKQADIILMTGGLGPTADDITKPLLCEYFGGKMRVDEAALENVKTIFQKYLNRPLLERNLKQAEVPDVCTVIQNANGTAPGMWFEKEGTVFISMPGVPFEMKGMMQDYVLPRLPSIFRLQSVVHKTLLVAGIGESFLAERLMDYEASLPDYVKLAYLPHYSLLRLRLTGRGDDQAAVLAEVNRLFGILQEEVADVMVINEDITLEEAIGKNLVRQGKTLSLAESCTGGYISHLITRVPGSSAYYVGGVVSYDNSIKEQVLGVNADTLDNSGAVSEETVWQMANGVRQLMATDYSVAVSGIMGPGGGTADKPVGLVWIGVSGHGKTVTQKFNFRFDRTRNIELTAVNALNMLRILMREHETVA
ncbi:CinA family nicotinamide mononucleotide deamidase-related protein [Segetibacter sp. 3557_3]|uniref:CinA family nicotinamide mononucleotide deamidase-related protein n=1 Tax=Segetibacter sp. 3557_3 TaxID=2547429 RepID=UPI001058406B|nr:CinA family nicotinamide mononucleotide deamidase-related protein [Segetibacter sp. 3557_3]TDH29218.1 CinA family nicotinamide mononucleotide deamidase-related protein [Segetibacter sp. 3557_3]